jgi:RHS repeat-associated protein
VGYTYLPDGRLATTVLDGVTVASLAYDPATTELSGVSYANGTSLGGIVKDLAGRVTGQTWTVGTRTFTETLTRSRAGRITRTVATDSADPAHTVDWAYGYDIAARLTTAVLAAAGTRPALTLGYGYAPSSGCGADPGAGANGSRVTATRQAGTAPVQTSTSCTDGASRLTAVTGAQAIPPEQIGYDSHSNATQLGSQRFSYDGADRVTATSTSDGAQNITYTRDATGRVTKRAGTGAHTTISRYGFTDDTDSPDLTLTTDGAIAERYLPLPGGVLYTKPLTGAGTFALANLHGDLMTLADDAGAVTAAGYVYDPFGQPLNADTGAVDLAAVPATRADTTLSDAWHGTAQRGYEHTSGLNQILMGARTYLPALGIFTATDPIPGGNTTVYAYPQDPINGSDLTGQWPDWDIDWRAVGQVVVAVAAVTAAVACGASIVCGVVVGATAAVASYTVATAGTGTWNVADALRSAATGALGGLAWGVTVRAVGWRLQSTAGVGIRFNKSSTARGTDIHWRGRRVFALHSHPFPMGSRAPKLLRGRTAYLNIHYHRRPGIGRHRP